MQLLKMLQLMSFALGTLMQQTQLAGTFDSLATFQAPGTTQGPTGNPVATYTAVVGLINIPCMDAPPSMARVQATEVKAVLEIMSKGLRHVLLNQCFVGAPNWSGEGYRVIIDGIAYDLLGGENDSQGIQTRIDLQLVSI
jgi:hypothetical protein